MTDDEREAQRKQSEAKQKARAEAARRSTAVNVKSGPPPPLPRESHSWRDNPEWPQRDPAGYVFLARAVDDIGKMLFGDEWTGLEGPAPLPDTSSYPYHRIYSPSESEKKATARFEEAQNTIAAAAEAKHLVTARRAVEGGKMIEFPAHYWNTDNILPRFHTCKIDPDYPFTSRLDRCSDPQWIFVKLDSLERLIKGFESKPIATNKARQRARELLTLRLSEPKPDGMTKPTMQQECMARTGVNDKGFRDIWKELYESGVMHPSWSRRGAPKLRR